MKLRNSIALAAVAALTAVPVAAQDTPTRQSQPATDSSELQGGSSIVLLVLALAAIIAGIVIAADSGDDSAVSP